MWSKCSFLQDFAIHGDLSLWNIFLAFLGNFNLAHFFILKIGFLDVMLMLANDLNAIIFLQDIAIFGFRPYETLSWLFRKFPFRALLHIYYWYHLINVHLYFTRGSLNVTQMQFSSIFWHLWHFFILKIGIIWLICHYILPGAP